LGGAHGTIFGYATIYREPEAKISKDRLIRFTKEFTAVPYIETATVLLAVPHRFSQRGNTFGSSQIAD
jgi:hypothetical protein